MTERKSLTVFVPASGVPVDVVLPVGAHGDWTGCLSALRIDPPPSSGAFSIDAVRVVSAAALAPAALTPLLERPATAVIDGVARLARLSPPPGRIPWDVQVSSHSVLRLACGLLPESWPFASSATRFTVTAASSPGGEPRTVFSRELRVPTLAGLLRDAGYSTAAFTGGGFAGRGSGPGRGFEVSWEGADPRAQVERLQEWPGHRPAQPVILYLHTFEAHDYLFERPHLVEEAERLAGRPLRLPAEVERRLVREAGAGLSREELHEVSLLYDGALRVADRQVGHWLKLLRDRGILDHAVVAVFADHGEAFGEHDVVHHGFSLFEELVRVPLVVRVFSPAGGEAAPDTSRAEGLPRHSRRRRRRR